MTDWANGVAIVTGGANGLGAAAAKSLQEIGMRVALWDLDVEAGEAMAASLGGLFFEVDIADPASVTSALDQVENKMGVPRVLVNSAGIAPFSPTIHEDGTVHDPELFKKVLMTNVFGTFNCSSQVAARMAKSAPVDADGARGAIIQVASGAAFEAPAGAVAYAASKSAIVGMMLPMARDFAGKGVRVNAIAPGIFDTRLADALPPEMLNSVAQRNPFPARIGDPAEFGHTVVYLATNAFVNVDVIRMDAGLRGL